MNENAYDLSHIGGEKVGSESSYDLSHLGAERINSSMGKKDNWKYPNLPYVGKAISEKEYKQSMKELREGGLGAAQSFLNTPEEAANVIGKHLYNKLNFAPKTKASETGGIVGDIASYFMPSNIITGTLKGASLIPKAAKAIDLAKTSLKAKPITNFLLNLSKNTGEAALFQKEKNPESTGLDVTKAAAFGGAIPIAASAVTAGNPLISLLGKLGLGGALGYQANGIPGMFEGAALGTAVPKILKELGITSKPVSSEFLTEQPNADAQARVEAGNRLGTPLRPSEAFNSPGIARNEGMIQRSETGGQHMAAHGQQRIVMQKNAINNLLNMIFDKSDKSKNNIRSLYQQVYTNDLNANAMNELFEDPVLSQASNKVLSDPAYQSDLKNVRANNYAYLDQVKRVLDDMKVSAEKVGEGNKARIYGNSQQKLLNEMDAQAPEYAQARMEAEKQITRREIEKAMKKKPITGGNFFNKFLANDDTFNELLIKVRNVPEAQQHLKDMKLAWEHLIGQETPRAAAGSAARSMSTGREGMSAFWNIYKDVIGAPRDIERANFIHDPDWWDKFDEVMKYKTRGERADKLGQLISRTLAAGLLEKAKTNKGKK